MSNIKNNKPDPRACPKCLKFPCRCPGGGAGDENTDEETSSDDSRNEDNSSFVEAMTIAHTDDMTNDFLTELDEELIVSVAPTPRPETEVDEDEKEQNNRPAWCTLFAILTTENQASPMHSSGKVALDDTENNTSCVNMGMSVGGSGK